jgi:hypothetical protein
MEVMESICEKVKQRNMIRYLLSKTNTRTSIEGKENERIAS